MLQQKQLQRLVSKVSRLTEVYKPFQIAEKVPQKVFLRSGPAQKLVQKGTNWGKDFAVAEFCFVAEGLKEGGVYHIFANTGATEHLVSVNGSKVGLLDFIDHAMEPQARLHRYLLLENLRNGDEVCLQAYFSHTIAGTMPYDKPATFSLDGLYPVRPYQEIALVQLNRPLCSFCTALDMFNKLYQSTSNQCLIKHMQQVYVQLFGILPLKQQCPQQRQLQQATALLNNFFRQKQPVPFVGLIGHSHLDTAWLWTTEETKRKLLRTLSNAVTLLERYPDYKFFLSTVLYLQWVEQEDKQLFQKVCNLASQGRLEINGAAWVECDGNLTGAEALCRQFLRGQRYTKQKLGIVADTFWLPDTFGYSAALPQIMRQSGVKFFLTTKLSWNDTTTFPYTSFVWQGLDGSRVTVHFNSIHSWADEQVVAQRTQSGEDCLVAYGFGDGGGGPSEEMVQQALHTQQFCQSAEVRHITVSQFMQRLQQQQLPCYSGELYLELHRGTYTSNSGLKQLNRRLEEALSNAEKISVFAQDTNAKALTDKLYDVLLLNQFHDILPGTCIAEVNDEATKQLQNALKKAQKYMEGSGRKRHFNTLGFARKEIVTCAQGQTYVAANGQLRTVALHSFAPYGYGKRCEAQGSFSFDGQNIVTPQLSATLSNGVLTSLVFHGKQFVKGAFNLVQFAEDVPYIYDNWDIDADYVLKQKQARFVSQQLVSQGQYLLVVRVTFAVGEKSLLTTDIKFRKDTPLAEFENHLSFHDDHTLVRTYFQTTLFASHYNCQTQFGHVERNCWQQSLQDAAKFEVCSHKWTDLSQADCGLSLLSDSKYGVSCDGGTLGLTLHKSGTHPDHRADNGDSYFRYALLPHDGPLSTETINQAYAFSIAPVRTAFANLQPPFSLQGDQSVVVETVKFAEEGGVVVRMYQSLGGDAQVTLQAENKQIFQTDIPEQNCTLLSKNSAILHFSPFEIKSILIK